MFSDSECSHDRLPIICKYIDVYMPMWFKVYQWCNLISKVPLQNFPLIENLGHS